MGKKSKRSRERDEMLEKLLSKVQKLEERLEGSERIKTASEDKENADVSNVPEIVAEKEIVSDSVSCVNECEENTDKLVDETANELDQDWLKFFGEDPTSSQAANLQINAELLKRWKFFCNEGLKKEEVESLLGSYRCVSELEPPKLNPQIAATMKDIAISRDNHMIEIQKMAGTALSILGSVVTGIYEDGDDFDLEKLLTRVRDSGNLLASIIHKQTVTRKAFIEPGLSKQTKAILKDTKPEEFLYGKELSEKIKEAMALNKLSDSLKLPQAAKRVSTPNQQSNFRIPFVRRPMGRQTGSTSFAGRLKQKVSLRNKQQFVNHKAQVHHSPKASNTVERTK